MSTQNNNFVALCLRGTSQVFFQNNLLTGVLFFAAIFAASYESGVWATSIGALIGVVIATLTAYVLNVDDESLNTGLFGFNGVLVGVALPTFLSATPSLWFYIIIGSAISTVVTAAFSSTITKIWKIPGSTGPFVLTAWLLVAGAYAFGDLNLISEKAVLPTDYTNGLIDIPSAYELVQIFFRNIGQVFLLGSTISGVLVLIGIFVASVPAGIAAVLGSIIAMAVSIGLGANAETISAGLFGFSPVLTAIAVGVVFLKTSMRVALYAGLATIATVFVQAAMDSLMLPVGLPSFTAPYVLTMYLFIAPGRLAAPHPHRPIHSDENLATTD
ncbi:urea transporter [Orrella sp. 11846]|uniref:urea transporter n=1 Tax=Orrella sp. 11846 TaxID=3409913 RepID=UPI003B59EBB1